MDLKRKRLGCHQSISDAVVGVDINQALIFSTTSIKLAELRKTLWRKNTVSKLGAESTTILAQKPQRICKKMILM